MADKLLSPQLSLKLLLKFENEQFIVINNNGEINYDEKTLQIIIGEFYFKLFYFEYRLSISKFSRNS